MSGSDATIRSVQELSLRGCPGLSPETVAFAGLRCPNLRVLDLGYNKEGAVSYRIAFSLLNLLRLHPVCVLSSLPFTLLSLLLLKVNDEVLRRVAGCAPNLESLTIHRASHITDEVTQAATIISVCFAIAVVNCSYS